jgi:hypothetical protein
LNTEPAEIAIYRDVTAAAMARLGQILGRPRPKATVLAAGIQAVYAYERLCAASAAGTDTNLIADQYHPVCTTATHPVRSDSGTGGGIAKNDLTAEDVLARWTEVNDLDRVLVPTSMQGYVQVRQILIAGTKDGTFPP